MHCYTRNVSKANLENKNSCYAGTLSTRGLSTTIIGHLGRLTASHPCTRALSPQVRNYYKFEVTTVHLDGRIYSRYHYLNLLPSVIMKLGDLAVFITVLCASARGAEAYCSASPVVASQMTLPLHLDALPTASPQILNLETVKTHCEVIPLGWGRDDSAQIMKAAALCGNGGTITLPAHYTYTISQRLYMQLNNARLNVHGILSFTPDLGYWINNSHRVQFQNMSTAWIIEGNNFEVDGGGWQQGGINGNGQAWYGRAAGQSNQYGRPIALSVYNSNNVTVNNFAFYQPQFWSIFAQDSKNISFTNIYINGTNTDPYGNGSNWATNIDGIDTMRVDQLRLENWSFRGGDDCFAPKGNSTNMVLRNMTCVGGGIAFGSVGQFPGSPDYITNVSVTDVHVSQLIDPVYGGANVSGGAYFKSWVGVEMGNPPQGGGGGTGRVSNVTFHNLTVKDTTQAVYINKCYYKVPAQAGFCDTSTFEFQDLNFEDVSGTVHSAVGINLNCSLAAPCHNIAFSNLSIQQTGANRTASIALQNAYNVTGVENGTGI